MSPKYIQFIVGIDDVATGAAIAGSVYSLGQNMFGQGGISHHDERAMKRLYQYQQDQNLAYQKKLLEEYTKPYYEWQKKNDAKLNVEGLKAAGINPLMAYGGSGLPQVGDSLQASPTPETLSGLIGANAAQEQTDISRRMANAEILNTTANTAKTIADTKSVSTFNKFAKDLYQGQAQTAKGNALLIDEQVKLTKSQNKQIYKSMLNLDAQTDQIKAMTDNLKETLNILRQQGVINEKTIDNIASQTALTMVKTLREQFALEHIDPETANQIKANTKYLLMSGDALLPTIYWAQYLQSSGKASEYFEGLVNQSSGQGWVNVTQGEQGNISLAIRSGNFPKLFKKTWDDATKGLDGPAALAAGAAACGQMITQVVIQNIGTVLGQLAGFVK